MPKQENVYRIFVGSPSDVQDEREVLEEVVAELNLHLSKTLGLRFDLVKWETHTYPDMGAGAQEVINQQVNDDYDIFLGIMWARVGTKTNKHASGTIEEFENAFERKNESPDRPHIMFYFKNAPISPIDIDPIQLQALQAFKKDLEKKGVLYKSFNSLGDFTTQIRINFNQLAQDLSKGLPRTNSSDNEKNDNSLHKSDESFSASAIEEEELGFFDYLEKGTSNITSSTESMAIMTEAMESLGTEVKKVTAQIPTTGTGLSTNKIKEIYTIVAKNMVTFSDNVDTQLPIFGESFGAGLSYFIKAVEISGEFGISRGDIEGVLDSIIGMKSSMVEIIPQVKSFREIAFNIQRATTKINAAKRRTVNSMDLLINELERKVALCNEAIEFLNNLLNDF